MDHPDSPVTALLGPTNTGKTHFAVERMLGHSSGVIGLPLRLLAREVYDRVVTQRGARAAALFTGEERIAPDGAPYTICTVEAMPASPNAAFVAVDEIQLAADHERGHVFTTRILHARGREETMFMGADTIRPLLRRLVPRAEIVERARFSKLTFAGARKMSRLPPRSAIVAFAVDDVYAIAEFIRRHRGGAAVVMGALSPRTRNAQVAMFEAGEVDYLVATDAIGMGLNLNVNHVAFARLRKFDGGGTRALTPAELGQIAGRAGRYMNDGSFGTTSGAPDLDADVIEAILEHRYPPLHRLHYRNAKLDTSSVPGLINSLAAPPPRRFLVKGPEGEDVYALKALYREPDIAQAARAPERVRLLWRVCSIPDFRKSMLDAHVNLLGQIYRHLIGPGGVLPTDWLAGHVTRLDRTDGDIDTLSTRLAHIRTWAFVAHRGDWLADPGHWQERTRAVEDRLSDALHQRLTQRFVDHRTAALTRRLKDPTSLHAAVEADGSVLVEGHAVGTLTGFRFAPQATDATLAGKALRAAAGRALRREVTGRALALAGAPDEAFTLDDAGRIRWRGDTIAKLAPGVTARTPRLVLMRSDLLSARMRAATVKRLEAWLADHISRAFAPLDHLDGAALRGTARGLAYHLDEHLGIAWRRDVSDLVAALAPADMRRLQRFGVRFGRVFVFVPLLVKPARRRLALILWAAHRGIEAPPVGRPGHVSMALSPGLPDGYYEAAGYAVVGGRALRVDMLERLAETVDAVANTGPVTMSSDLLSLVGCTRADFPQIMAWLGFRPAKGESSGQFVRDLAGRRRPDGGARPPEAVPIARSHARADPNSPFASLGTLFPERAASPSGRPKKTPGRRTGRRRRRAGAPLPDDSGTKRP